MTTLLVLPPHLIEKIQELLKSDVDLPQELRDELDRATSNRNAEYDLADTSEDDDSSEGPEDRDKGDLAALTVKETPPQRTIPYQTIEELSRWAGSHEGIKQLEKNGLESIKYNTISLLAGTEIYIPPNELERLKLAESGDKPNPYLPSYLSPSTSTSSFGKDFRNLSKTISTVLNILFSIFGSSIAVYVVSTSSAGYSREISILLGILTGIIVGVADVVLVYLYTRKLDEGRRESKKVGLKMLRGSGKIGEKDEGEKDSSVDGEKEDETVVDLSQTNDTLSTAVKKEVRLRRRELRGTS